MTPLAQNNPITQAELKYQRWEAAKSKKARRLPALFALVLIVGLLSNLLVPLVPQIAPQFALAAADLRDALRSWLDTLAVLIAALLMIQHLSLATSGLHLAVMAIAREKQGHTWESLILTGVSARRIILGKWLATLHTLWAIYRPLLALRLAVVLWVGVANRGSQLSSLFRAPSLLVVIVVGIVLAVFPLIYAGFTAALGLLAALVVSDRAAALRIAVLLHFGTIVLSLGLFVALYMLIMFDIPSSSLGSLPSLFLTPLDGGMLALVSLLTDNGYANGYAPPNYLIGLIACVAFYTVFVLVILRGVQALAVRQRALPSA